MRYYYYFAVKVLATFIAMMSINKLIHINHIEKIIFKAIDESRDKVPDGLQSELKSSFKDSIKSRRYSLRTILLLGILLFITAIMAQYK